MMVTWESHQQAETQGVRFAAEVTISSEGGFSSQDSLALESAGCSCVVVAIGISPKDESWSWVVEAAAVALASCEVSSDNDIFKWK